MLIREMRTEVLAAILVVLSGLGVSCDGDASGSEPVLKPETELDFVPVRLAAPPLETMDTSFWAVLGEDRELEIRFQGQGGPGTGSRFFELEVRRESLSRRPDGTAFALGDSIEIRVTVDPGLYLVRLEPAGLRFNPSEPARLEIDYEEADENFLPREPDFDVWRQEQVGQDWELLNSARREELDEIEVFILGFTRYALAIGR